MQKNKQPYYPTACPEKYSMPISGISPGFELLGSWERSKKIDSTGLSQCNKLYHLEDVLESDADLIIVNTSVGTYLNMQESTVSR
jgi:hypothetical protein